MDTRIRSERRPQPFSRNDKYISGWIHGSADPRIRVSVDSCLSEETISIFLGGYVERRLLPFSRNDKYISGWIRGYAVSVGPSLSQEMISIFLGGYA